MRASIQVFFLLIAHTSLLIPHKDINLKIFKKVLSQFIQNKKTHKIGFMSLFSLLMKCISL